MTRFEYIQTLDAKKMADFFNGEFESDDYKWCSESKRRACRYDAHSCDECIYAWLEEDFKA